MTGMQSNVKNEVMVENDGLPLGLPKSKLPEDWDNDMRMSYLYSQIRPAEVNPLDYESKIKFWSRILELWCLHNKRPAFTLNDLKKAFIRNGSYPNCLPQLLEKMLRNGELVHKSSFVQISSQQSLTAWALDYVVKKPVVWAFTKVKDTMYRGPLFVDDTVLVHVGVCKELGKKLVSEQSNQLLELSELAALWDMQDVEQVLVVVHGLVKERRAAIEEGSPTLVKLGSHNISEMDRGVHMLSKNEKTLSRHIEQLEDEMEAAVQQARQLLSQGRRKAARSCLRKKHVLEKCTEKRVSALDNVHVLLSRIREADTDAKVLEAYKLGVSALKTTFKTSGLTEDSASETMLQVQEVLDVQDEIESALSQPVQKEDDLEAELAELLQGQHVTDAVPTCGSLEFPAVPEDHDELEERLKALLLPDPPVSRPAPQKVRVAKPAV